jgi:predicted nucleotidyltransferase
VRLGCFGSYARGDAGVGSDLDPVAVVDSTDRPFLERPRDWSTERLPVPTELLVYTTEEWDRLQHDGGRFARTLATEASWVFDRSF